jgi:hypothetical protein
MVSCLFCGRTGAEVKITKEHVFGDWTKDVLPEQGRLRFYRGVTQDPITGHVSRTTYEVPEPHHQTQLRRFCESCNGGWMNNLEAGVQPLAPSLFGALPSKYTTDDAVAIAAWISKSAMVRDAMDPIESRAVSVAHRRWMNVHHLPAPGTWVWIACMSSLDGRPPASRHRRLIVEQPGGIGDNPYANTYITTFGFDRLVLFVLGTRVTKGVVIQDPEALLPQAVFRLWPYPAPFTWPPRSTLSDQQVAELSDGDGIITLPPNPRTP